MRSASRTASATSRRHEIDRNQSLRDTARLDAALCAQRREALRVACVQAYRVAARAEVGGGGATTMSCAENRNRIHCHFAFRVRNVMEGVTEDRIMGGMGRCQQTRDSRARKTEAARAVVTAKAGPLAPHRIWTARFRGDDATDDADLIARASAPQQLGDFAGCHTGNAHASACQALVRDTDARRRSRQCR